MAANSPWILETPPADFQTDVVDRSQQLPIVVDFWAPWCGPCKTLVPILEAAAIKADGRFLLIKVNVDENQELAGAFGVSSIPAVFALFEGQMVNRFDGLLTAEQLDEWLGTFLPPGEDDPLVKGKSLEESDLFAAEACYREALADEDAKNADALRVALARVLAATDQGAEAGELIATLAKRGFLEPEAEQVKAQLELQQGAAESGSVIDARAAVEANPDDSTKQILLADALAVDKQHEEALQICLEVVRRDRNGAGDEARQTMVRIFEVLGPAHSLTSKYRRQLATLLY